MKTRYIRDSEVYILKKVAPGGAVNASNVSTVGSMVTKKKKGRKKGRKKKEEEESLEREEKEDERRIISIERNRWEDAKQTRFPEWQSSSFENPIFQDFGYTTAMTSKWISSSMTHAILINFSSNRRAIPNTKIISGQMFFPVKNFHDRCVRDVVGLQFKNCILA